MRTVHLTEPGVLYVEKLLNKPNIYQEDFVTLHHIESALKATNSTTKNTVGEA